VALRALTFDFPRSIGRKYMDGSRCHTPVSILRDQWRPSEAGSPLCDSCREIPFPPPKAQEVASWEIAPNKADPKLDRQPTSSLQAYFNAHAGPGSITAH